VGLAGDSYHLRWFGQIVSGYPRGNYSLGRVGFSDMVPVEFALQNPAPRRRNQTPALIEVLPVQESPQSTDDPNSVSS
jgi:hypothetical protein